MRNTILIVAALMAAACSNSTTDPDGTGVEHQVDVGQTVQLRVGEAAAIRGTGVVIRFVSVKADSRCPTSAVCVWQGDAHIRLDLVHTGGFAGGFDVHTTLDPKAVDFVGYHIRLAEVAPYPQGTDPIPARDYSIKLEVTR